MWSVKLRGCSPLSNSVASLMFIVGFCQILFRHLLVNFCDFCECDRLSSKSSSSVNLLLYLSFIHCATGVQHGHGGRVGGVHLVNHIQSVQLSFDLVDWGRVWDVVQQFSGHYEIFLPFWYPLQLPSSLHLMHLCQVNLNFRLSLVF